jgi:hypothetical protein
MYKSITTSLMFLCFFGFSLKAEANDEYTVDVPLSRAGMVDANASAEARRYLIIAEGGLFGIKQGSLVTANFNDGLTQVFVVNNIFSTLGLAPIADPYTTPGIDVGSVGVGSGGDGGVDTGGVGGVDTGGVGGGAPGDGLGGGWGGIGGGGTVTVCYRELPDGMGGVNIVIVDCV